MDIVTLPDPAAILRTLKSNAGLCILASGLLVCMFTLWGLNRLDGLSLTERGKAIAGWLYAALMFLAWGWMVKQRLDYERAEREVLGREDRKEKRHEVQP